MGSMGLLLADWSIQLIKSRRQKGKQKKENGKTEKRKDGGIDETCTTCQSNHTELNLHRVECRSIQTQHDALVELLRQFSSELRTDPENPELEDQLSNFGSEKSLVEYIRVLIKQSQEARIDVEAAREERNLLAEGIGRQLAERDRVHSEKLQSVEILMHEKEKQLIEAANVLRQQLTAAKRNLVHLQDREEQLIQTVNFTGNSLEQEVQSLRIVLEMRRVEVDQLRAANNALMLEMERCLAQEHQLQQQNQRVEEMEMVIQNKNIEIRKLYDDQETLQHQLDIEESAHLSCQQELERSQWALENFVSCNREKAIGRLKNLKDASLILDLVHKDKSVAYSINC